MMTEDPGQLQEFLAALQVGSHDGELDEIEQALKYRRGVLNRRRASTLTPGTEVRFVATVRPKYLAGMTATIIDKPAKGRDEVWVKTPIDDPRYRKFRGEVRVQLNLIEGA